MQTVSACEKALNGYYFSVNEYGICDCEVETIKINLAKAQRYLNATTASLMKWYWAGEIIKALPNGASRQAMLKKARQVIKE